MYEQVKKPSSSWSPQVQKKASKFGPQAFKSQPLPSKAPQEMPTFTPISTDWMTNNPLMRMLENAAQNQAEAVSPEEEISTEQPTIQRQEEQQAPDFYQQPLTVSPQPPGNWLSAQPLPITTPQPVSGRPLDYPVMRSALTNQSQQIQAEADTSQEEVEAEDSIVGELGEGKIQPLCDDCASQLPEEEKEPVQAKLTVGQAGDKYEQEADAVARQVVEKINAPVSEPSVQRQSEVEGASQLNITVMRHSESGSGEGMAVTQDVEAGIQQARGGGRSLDESVREPMEGAFGADFSRVRVHTDTNSDVLNRSLSARAFSTGQGIFFKQGEYDPGSRGGQELLAHELTHVVQQTGGAQLQRKLDENNIQRSAEAEAIQLTETQVQYAIVYNRERRYSVEAIKQIQRTVGAKDDGIIGSNTVLAIASWQAKNGLDVDGKVGLNTFAKISSFSPTHETETPGVAQVEEELSQTEIGMLTESTTANGVGETIVTAAQSQIGKIDYGQQIPSLEKPNKLEPYGWQHLGTIYQEGANKQWNQSELLKSWRPGNTDWCGIFATYSYQLAGVNTTWSWGVGLTGSSVKKFWPYDQAFKNSRSAFEASIRPGDIAAISAKQHHFIVVSTEPASGAMHTVDGNQELGRIKARSDHKLSEVVAYYTPTVNAGGGTAMPLKPFVGKSILFSRSTGSLVDKGSKPDDIDLTLSQSCTAKPDEVKAWRELLDVANRGASQEIKVIQVTDQDIAKNRNIARDPKLENTKAVMANLTDKQKCVVKAIKDNRDTIETKMFTFGSYKGKYGYMYGDPQAPGKAQPTAFATMGNEGNDKLRRAIWAELMETEGGSGAINAYDGARLSWGPGMAMGGALSKILNSLFKDQAILEQFLPYGITWENNSFLVVNTANGFIESGDNALNLIQANKQLLGVFVRAAQVADSKQKVIDAQFTEIDNLIKKIPPYAANWDIDVIRFAFHLDYMAPKYGWSKHKSEYEKTGGKIQDIIMLWGKLASGGKEPSGAYLLSADGWALTIDQFKKWGNGVAWKALEKVCPIKLPLNKSEIKDAKRTEFVDLLFIRNLKGDGYYAFPFMPRPTVNAQVPVNASKTLYYYYYQLNGLPMKDMLGRLKTYDPASLDKLLANYDQFIPDFGMRTKIGIQAAITKTKKKNNKVFKEKKEDLFSNPEFAKLPPKQQDEIKTFLK